MKIKLHIDINTYEFVEFEIDGEVLDIEQIKTEIKKLHSSFHKLCDPQVLKGE